MKKLHDLFIGDYKITQNFGVNYEAYKWIKDYKGNPIKGHNGVDFGTPNHTPLLNPFPKDSEVVVSKVGYDEKGYGWFLRIWDKTQRCVALYAHCEKILVKEGDRLAFQQLVAYSDNTGWSTGPHLHFGFYEVDDQGNKLNRDNGFDGYLNPLSGVVKWEILNPKTPYIPSESQQSSGQADFYKGLDLNNKESMKACVDVWKDVVDDKYIRKEEYEKLKQENENLKDKIISYGTLQEEKNTLAIQLKECQRQRDIYKAEYENATKQGGYIEQIRYLEEAKKKQQEEISELTRQVRYWQTKYKNLRKSGIKFIQAVVIEIAEKLGIDITKL